MSKQHTSKHASASKKERKPADGGSMPPMASAPAGPDFPVNLARPEKFHSSSGYRSALFLGKNQSSTWPAGFASTRRASIRPLELPIRRRGGLRRLTCCSAPVVRDRILGARLAIDLRYTLGTLRLGHIAVTSRLGFRLRSGLFLFGSLALFHMLNIFCSVGLGAIIPFEP